MNDPVAALLLGLVCAFTVWLLLLGLSARVGAGARSLKAKLGLGAAAMLLMLLPVAGRPLWTWAFSFCPNPSVLLVGLLAAGLWQRLFREALLSASEWTTAWVFGFSAGLAIYLHHFLAAAPDVYFLGWHEGLAAWSIAGLGVALVAGGSRVGILFLAALVAYEFGALESHNAWDYVVDPLYWLASCGVLLTRFVKWGQAVLRQRRSAVRPRTVREDAGEPDPAEASHARELVPASDGEGRG